MIYKNRDFRNVHRFSLKIRDICDQHLNQALVVRCARFRAKSKKRKAKRINSQMPFDPVRCFVNAETFGINSSIAGVLNRLGVDDDQGCPFWFFLTCSRTLLCSTSLIASKIFSSRHFL